MKTDDTIVISSVDLGKIVARELRGLLQPPQATQVANRIVAGAQASSAGDLAADFRKAERALPPLTKLFSSLPQEFRDMLRRTLRREVADDETLGDLLEAYLAQAEQIIRLSDRP